MPQNRIAPADLEALRRIDACTLSNALEMLNIRPRNEGFIQRTVTCMFPRLPPVAGYAVTGRIRTATPPVGGHCYYENVEFWRYVETVPVPRILVLEDADDPPGTGALFGEIHARICTALQCVAYVTNGAVRDLPAVETLGFQLFAGHVSVSHAYAHVAEFGQPVTMGGLLIHPGDLLHGDQHGVQSIPFGAALKLPGIATQVLRDEQQLREMCIGGNFSVDRLSAKIREHAEGRKCK
jgi:4-hydroxy-4-methyl-2-oxoglutarate aldolase